jgi:hypothetical protein
MSPEDYFTYLRGIDILETREVLRLCNVMDWPNMDKKDRSQMFSKLKKIAYPTESKKTVSNEDLAKLLGVQGVRGI